MLLGGSYKTLKRSDEKIISDCLEALIGAIYMDIGLIHAKEFILRIYQDPEIA